MAKAKLKEVPKPVLLKLDLGCGPKKIFPAKHVIGIDNNKDLQLFGTVANPDIQASVDKLDMFADVSP